MLVAFDSDPIIRASELAGPPRALWFQVEEASEAELEEDVSRSRGVEDVPPRRLLIHRTLTAAWREHTYVLSPEGAAAAAPRAQPTAPLPSKRSRAPWMAARWRSAQRARVSTGSSSVRPSLVSS